MNTANQLANFVLPTYGRFPITLVRGEGTRVWDDGGKDYQNRDGIRNHPATLAILAWCLNIGC